MAIQKNLRLASCLLYLFLERKELLEVPFSKKITKFANTIYLRLSLHIPPHSPEIEFSLKILFNDILGLEYETKIIEDITKVELVLNNGKTIIFEESFFKNTNGKYTTLDLPYGITKFKHQNKTYKILNLGSEKTQSTINIKNESTIRLTNILASTFFFASRWEETLINAKDKHSRISAEETFLYKNNLLNIPWVEEYALLLKDIMQSLCPDMIFPKKKFTIQLTHDIDNPYLFYNFKTTLKYFGILALREFNIKEIIFGLKSLFHTKDPYDTVEYLMEQSERVGLKSTFYILAGEKGESDYRYSLNDKRIKATIAVIGEKGHKIGIHPGLKTFDNQAQISKEIERINNILPKEVAESRQHFLKFDITKTPYLLSQNNIKTDSTLCYHNYIGFRTGICREHSLFDLQNRKTLKIREKPLTIMDTTLRKYLNLSEEEAFNTIQKYMDLIKKYNGEFVLLWHNSSFNTYYWSKYKTIYPKIIQLIKNNIR